MNISGLVPLSRRSVYHDESAQYTYFRPGSAWAVRVTSDSETKNDGGKQAKLLCLGCETFFWELLGCKSLKPISVNER